MPSASFEKDFKYLWPFFDRLKRHAATLPQPSSAALLDQVQAARVACEAVADQLGPASEVSAASEASAAPEVSAAPGAGTSAGIAAPPAERRWTVGPLNPRQRPTTPDSRS